MRIMYCDPVKFGNVEIGQIFTFVFDRTNDWKYEKVSENEVKCVAAPKCFSIVIGTVDLFIDGNVDVIIHSKS